MARENVHSTAVCPGITWLDTLSRRRSSAQYSIEGGVGRECGVHRKFYIFSLLSVASPLRRRIGDREPVSYFLAIADVSAEV